jgi:DNA polymerase (family X)
MKLHYAMSLAEAVQNQLGPYCHKLEIAGSIRRARPEVNDVDLVALPKAGQVEALKARCRQRCRVIRDGGQNFIVAMKPGAAFGLGQHDEFQLDIFIARPSETDLLSQRPGNFGSLLLCRTGSREHNILLCQNAKKADMKWHPYEGLLAGGEWDFEGQDAAYRGGTVIASETEEEIFEALGMKWVAPRFREAAGTADNVNVATAQLSPHQS